VENIEIIGLLSFLHKLLGIEEIENKNSEYRTKNTGDRRQNNEYRIMNVELLITIHK